jgi:hypothetical protein
MCLRRSGVCRGAGGVIAIRRMTAIAKIFFAYMTLVGLASGGALVLWPQLAETWFKPYFWILIAVGLFDFLLFLVWRGHPFGVMSMNVRVAGWVYGLLLMAAVTIIAGVKINFV